MGKKIEYIRTRLVREDTNEYIAECMGSPEKVAEILNRVFELESDPAENLCVLFLNNKNQVNAVTRSTIGGMTETVVDIPGIFRTALLQGAVSIILAHNHPSGNPMPSQEDRRLTQRTIDCGKLLGIKVLDHVIVGYKKHIGLRGTTGLWDS